MRWSIAARFASGARAAPGELGAFLNGKYPGFVTAARPSSLPTDEVPVFMYHTVERAVFEEQMEYLQTNGYQTLTLRDFIAVMRGDARLKRPSVLLTFDDGDKSWYEAAFPLLKGYGFHGVAFVVPGFIRDEPDCSSGRGWLSWPQLVEMERSGVFDVQSHSLYHGQVYVGPELVDFYSPAFSRNSLGLDIPWTEINGDYTNKLPPGAPIYRHRPRLAGELRYIEDEAVRGECADWVESQGGSGFFELPHWRKQLSEHYNSLVKQGAGGRYESSQDRKEAMMADLLGARLMLEERLNKRVEHFCYPWGTGSSLSVDLSKKAGYVSNFWTVLSHRRANRPGDSLFSVTRCKDDYIFRLPGRGRKALWEIFATKLRRRLAKIDVY